MKHVTRELPKSMMETIIIIILKPDKDPLKPGSYRPISLLTSDVKILAKVLANRLSRHIDTLIHRDQTGFIPSRSAATNIRRLFLNLQLPMDNGGAGAILSLDAQKAFDMVEWEYLWMVLIAFGIGPGFITWLKLLYKDPRARLRINGTMSPAFPLSRGTRQGCPLSPLLFALAVEPLAAAVRQSSGIEGFRRAGREDKISLYADDALIFLSDPTKSLEELMALVSAFGQFSGFRINWEKSVLMPLHKAKISLPDCAKQIQIKYKIKYLGIQVTQSGGLCGP